MNMRAPLLFIVLSLVAAPPLAGQAKPAPPAAQTPPATAAPQLPPPAPVENYAYDPSGRRDPFLNLLGTGNEPSMASRRGEGKAGLMVAELSVRGVMQTRGAFIAMVQGPDGKTFLVHQGDRLADGLVREVNAEGLVVVQEVKDPSSLVKQREVSKKLPSLEAKQ